MIAMPKPPTLAKVAEQHQPSCACAPAAALVPATHPAYLLKATPCPSQPASKQGGWLGYPLGERASVSECLFVASPNPSKSRARQNRCVMPGCGSFREQRASRVHRTSAVAHGENLILGGKTE